MSERVFIPDRTYFLVSKLPKPGRGGNLPRVQTDVSPTIYRIDRIQNYKTLDRHFAQRYTDRFQEGEMRKRIQFMYGGELQTIRFEYTGPSLESVLDRLPTAKVLQVTEKGWIVEAEVFGTGIQMWVRSQGGVEKNSAKAVEWYRKSAENGNAFAQYNLGLCYEYGTGVTLSKATAAEWYRKAADQGDADAQYKLGVFYENGYGVIKDEAQAMQWYKKAAEQGNESAKNAIDRMQSSGMGAAVAAGAAAATVGLLWKILRG